jgi:hypothetical protein
MRVISRCGVCSSSLSILLQADKEHVNDYLATSCFKSVCSPEVTTAVVAT